MMKVLRKPALGAARGCQNRWGNLTTQPPHGLCALLKTKSNFIYERVLMFSVPCGYYCTPSFCVFSLVCSVEESHNILAAPRRPQCRLIAVISTIKGYILPSG